MGNKPKDFWLLVPINGALPYLIYDHEVLSTDHNTVHVREVSPEREAAIAGMAEACSDFKRSFDKGFPNSLNAIEARDRIFDALAAWRAANGGGDE